VATAADKPVVGFEQLAGLGNRLEGHRAAEAPACHESRETLGTARKREPLCVLPAIVEEVEGTEAY